MRSLAEMLQGQGQQAPKTQHADSPLRQALRELLHQLANNPPKGARFPLPVSILVPTIETLITTTSEEDLEAGVHMVARFANQLQGLIPLREDASAG